MPPSDDPRAQAVAGTLRQAARMHEQAAEGAVESVLAAADVMTAAFTNGGKVLIFGNGGSAADAQHFACELSGRFLRSRRALAAVALTTDTSTITAVANDYGFDRIFVRQIEALGRPGDVAIGISTSGTSANVVAGLQFARSRGLKTVAFTGGTGGAVGEAGRMADIHLNVPDGSTARAQEVHRTLLHAICEIVEAGL